MNIKVIENISSFFEWKKIFNYLLTISDNYDVVFPDGTYDEENPLMGGMDKFLKIEDISLKKDNEYLIASGALDQFTRNLFLNLVYPSFSGDKSELWHWQLLKDGKVLLRIEDFDVGIVYNYSEIEEYLKKT